ncbi:MAG: hypothetical protein LBQ90_10545 [Synergistaceae bacterium]|nr:hypothetical protein [Synergistaceae bacterium]
MALVICTMCRRAFFNDSRGGKICPDCATKLQELYPVVRNFLRDHEKESYTIYDVSRILGIPPRHVEALVSFGMINTSDAERTRPERERRTPKIAPLDPEAAKDILKGEKSSMHTYTKKIRDGESPGNKKKR